MFGDIRPNCLAMNIQQINNSTAGMTGPGASHPQNPAIVHPLPDSAIPAKAAQSQNLRHDRHLRHSCG
jgi:hypothetical protein